MNAPTRKRGRPRATRPRSKMVTFRLTRTEFERMQSAAKLDGYRISDWLRMLLHAALDAYEAST